MLEIYANLIKLQKKIFILLIQLLYQSTNMIRLIVQWASDETKLGKNIFGYYYGFKLHIIINRRMEVVSCMITTANVHDVKMLSIELFIVKIKGKLVGDKGHVCPKKLLKKFMNQGLKGIFKQRKNMNSYLNEFYKKDLSQRQKIEGVFQLFEK